MYYIDVGPSPLDHPESGGVIPSDSSVTLVTCYLSINALFGILSFATMVTAILMFSHATAYICILQIPALVASSACTKAWDRLGGRGLGLGGRG